MSCQNHGPIISSSADPPMKRKRGRPRKDESVQGDSTAVTPSSENLKKNKQTLGTSDPVSDDMVGQMVSGVIEGSFDAGYLLNVKVHDTNMHLRGVVFLPGQFTPITAANDVAPHSKMYKRKEIPIPFVNPQGQLHAISPSSGKSEKPFEHKNDAPSLPDQLAKKNLPGQGLHIGLQSGAVAAGESQSVSTLIPPVCNLPINDTGLLLGQNVLEQQILDSGLQNEKAVGQNQSLLGFEAFKLMKGPNISVEAGKACESVSATFAATLPATETVNLQPQAERETVSSDLKPQELVCDDVKSLGLFNNHTPKFSELEPQAMACEPTGINMFEKQALSGPGIDISQDTHLELAKKIMSGTDSSHMDGLAASDAGTTAVTAPCSASGTSLPIMIFGAETIPSELKPAAEESVLPRMVLPEVSSSLMAANTTTVESNAKDAIPPAQS